VFFHLVLQIEGYFDEVIATNSLDSEAKTISLAPVILDVLQKKRGKGLSGKVFAVTPVVIIALGIGVGIVIGGLLLFVLAKKINVGTLFFLFSINNQLPRDQLIFQVWLHKKSKLL
jgi:hypothetical protein